MEAVQEQNTLATEIMCSSMINYANSEQEVRRLKEELARKSIQEKLSQRERLNLSESVKSLTELSNRLSREVVTL